MSEQRVEALEAVLAAARALREHTLAFEELLDSGSEYDELDWGQRSLACEAALDKAIEEAG